MATNDSLTHALDVGGRLKDLDVEHLCVANLGAGGRKTAFADSICALAVDELIQVEIHQPYIEELYGLKYDAKVLTVVCADMLWWAKHEPDKSIDVALLIDSLEHLPRNEGTELLKELLRITKERILIWLPLGQCKQDPYDENPHQAHRATYTERDFYWADNVEVFPDFHKHFDPPVSAAWITIHPKD